MGSTAAVDTQGAPSEWGQNFKVSYKFNIIPDEAAYMLIIDS